MSDDPNVLTKSDHARVVAYAEKVTGRREAAARQAADAWAAAELQRRRATNPDAAIAPEELDARVAEERADLVAQDLAYIDAHVAGRPKGARAFVKARLLQQRGHVPIPDPAPDPVETEQAEG